MEISYVIRSALSKKIIDWFKLRIIIEFIVKNYVDNRFNLGFRKSRF